MSSPQLHSLKVLCAYIGFLLCFSSLQLTSQQVYRTPSGTKYHLENCKMVENFSATLCDPLEVGTSGLKPCKICKPPKPGALTSGDPCCTGKAKGKLANSQQCKGNTTSGNRCRHKTRLANGYCYQHTSQSQMQNDSNSSYSSSNRSSTSSSPCGARTKTGKYCKRKVKGNGRCYQH